MRFGRSTRLTLGPGSTHCAPRSRSPANSSPCQSLSHSSSSFPPTSPSSKPFPSVQSFSVSSMFFGSSCFFMLFTILVTSAAVTQASVVATGKLPLKRSVNFTPSWGKRSSPSSSSSATAAQSSNNRLMTLPRILARGGERAGSLPWVMDNEVAAANNEGLVALASKLGGGRGGAAAAASPVIVDPEEEGGIYGDGQWVGLLPQCQKRQQYLELLLERVKEELNNLENCLQKYRDVGRT